MALQSVQEIFQGIIQDPEIKNLNQGQVQYIKGYADALENMAARMG